MPFLKLPQPSVRHAFVTGILWLCCLTPLPAGEQHFWDKQDPSTWTSQQVSQLTTASPWAKKTTAQLLSNSSNMAASSPRSGGTRGGRYSSRQSSDSSPATMPKFEAVVQWVSAKPMQEVLKPHLPPTFQGRYVLCVNGLPLTNDSTSAIEDTTLQGKRGDAIHPEVVYQDPNDTSAIYFGFLPSMLDAIEAKTLVFSMAVSPYEIKVRFNVAEMKYHGEPAL